MKLKLKIVLSLIFCLTSFNSFSIDYYWVSGIAASWNNAANWSLSSGGAGGAGIPGNTDVAIFDANGLGNCTVDIIVNVGGLTVNGYTSVIDLNGFNFTTSGTVNLATGIINDLPDTGQFIINSSGTSTFSGTTFGATVDVTSDRILLNGSIFNALSSFEKTGATNDPSSGGNSFMMDVDFECSGDGYFMMGNGTPDSCFANVTINNTGTDNFYFARNGAGHYVAGDITANHNASGGGTKAIYFSDRSSASLDILGDFTLTQNGSGNSLISYLGDQGDVTIGGNVTLTNSGSGTSSDIRLANNSTSTVDITGTTDVTNNATASSASRVYLGNSGNVTFNNNLTLLNAAGGNTSESYIANGTSSTVSISGTTNVTNDSNATVTNRVYLGNRGDVTFNGTLDIVNNANSINSEVFVSDRDSSFNNYNDNITISTTVANSDGIFFGRLGGFGTLAATKTITIGAGGFVSGELRFRNFTQVGNTLQNLTLTGDAILTNLDANWGGDVTFTAPRMVTDGTIYNRTAFIEKNGATNDRSDGGNTFMMDADFVCSGDGYFMMGNGTADSCFANLSINNTGTNNFYFAQNGAGHYVAGNLTAVHNASGGGTKEFYLSNGVSASLDILGNLSLTQNGTGDRLNAYIADDGDVTIGGNLTISNSGSGTTSDFRLADRNSSSVSIGGSTNVTNDSSAAVTNRVYLGNRGDVTFNGTLDIVNNAISTNSEVLLNYRNTSVNLYNDNITISSTAANGDGIRFGQAGGFGTLAATKTVSIGVGGFVSGELWFRNFTQVGNTTHNITLTGDALFYNYDANWGGDVTFTAPRMVTDGTIYNRTAFLEKNGATNDRSDGGNTFMMDADFVCSGDGYFMMGNGTADSCFANLSINNTGTNNFYFAQNGAGHYVAGNLTAVHNASGGGTKEFYLSNGVSASLDILGNLSLTQNGTGDRLNAYIADDGDVTIGGNLTISNSGSGTTSNFLLAERNSSSVSIGGSTDVTNDSTAVVTNRVYLGNRGDVTFNGTLDIVNNANSPNSEVFLNFRNSSVNAYNDNITLSTTAANSDGIRFGQNGGFGTLAATKTVSIGAGGFVSGELWFRNFTQVGNTTHNITLTGDALFYNYDANWGGDVTFIAPRVITRGTTYNRTAFLEKNGATNDVSVGGNTFMLDADFVCSGDGYFMMGNGTPDSCFANLSINNTGTNNFYFARNGAGHYVAGNLTASHSATGAGTKSFYIADISTSTLNVTGNVSITQDGSGNSLISYLGDQGDVTIGGNVTLTNSGSGTSSDIRLANNSTSTVDITGTTDVTNNATASSTSRVYLGNSGNVTFNNNLTLLNAAGGNTSESYIANGTSSTVSISGTSNVTNNSTAVVTNRVYLGNRGDVTFNGTLDIVNNANSINSEVFLNYRNTSVNLYNDNITISSTAANGDGIRFGQNGGFGTLAATKTVSIGAGGFVSGELWFRNFTQVGNTTHNITLSGDALFYNYDANWGGDVTFTAPRVITRGTTYNRTAFLEKNGATNDVSVGGNTFMMDADFVCSGDGYFMMGNGTADSCFANLSINNTGTDNFYFARNGAGHYIAGNLTATHSATGAGTKSFYIADISTSTLDVTGNVTITQDGSGNSLISYLADDGDVTIGGNLTISNSGSGTTSDFRLADRNSSSVSISGSTDVTNDSSAAVTNRVYLGNRGDVTFNGTLDIVNNANSINSEVFLNYRNTSVNAYNDNITLSTTAANSDGIRFGQNGGFGTLAATKTVSIGVGGFVSGELWFRNFTQVGNTTHNITLSGDALFYNYDANWGGDVTFTAPRVITRGTTYNRTAFLEKNGATNDVSVGGNTFMMNVDFVSSGSGYLMLGNGTFDTYSADVNLTNTGSNNFYFAQNGAGHTVAGNLTATHSATGAGTKRFYIADATTSTLNVTGNVSITQDGSGTSLISYLADDGDVTIGGNLTISNSGSGTTSDFRLADRNSSSVSIGGSTDVTNNSTAVVTNRVYLGNRGDVTFNGTLDIVNNANSVNSEIFLNDRASSINAYNDNITLSTTAANSDGIRFGQNGGTGTLAATKTIGIGAGGFVSGELWLSSFIQTGATAQTMTLTGSAILRFREGTIFDGNLTTISPRLFFDGGTFNGTNDFTKNGNFVDNSRGGATFNGVTTITNSSANLLRMSTQNALSDDFNNDVTFVRAGTGEMDIARNGINTFAGDITINGTQEIFFGRAGGTAIIDGAAAQVINDGLGSSASPSFFRLQMNKTSDDLTLNMPINLRVLLTLTNGNIISSPTNLLSMFDNSTVSGVSDNSFVRGPVAKIGNDAFTFPVGDSGLYRPIAISAPSSGADIFTATYFEQNTSPAYNHTLFGGTITNVSSREYWILDRTNGTSNVNVTLTWNTNSGGVNDLAELRVARWDGAKWADHGNGGTTGNTTSGSIISAAPVTSFSPFALSSTSFAANPLPITLVSFDANLVENSVQLNWVTASEINNDFFTVERSTDAKNFAPIFTHPGAGNSQQLRSYQRFDNQPMEGNNYYRLRQTDFDGKTEVSDIKVVNFSSGASQSIEIFPNPSSGEYLNIRFRNWEEGKYRFNVLNSQGQLIKSQESYVNTDENLAFNFMDANQSLSKGVYYLIIKGLNQNYSFKFIVQ